MPATRRRGSARRCRTATDHAPARAGRTPGGRSGPRITPAARHRRPGHEGKALMKVVLWIIGIILLIGLLVLIGTGTLLF